MFSNAEILTNFKLIEVAFRLCLCCYSKFQDRFSCGFHLHLDNLFPKIYLHILFITIKRTYN